MNYGGVASKMEIYSKIFDQCIYSFRRCHLDIIELNKKIYMKQVRRNNSTNVVTIKKERTHVVQYSSPKARVGINI